MFQIIYTSAATEQFDESQLPSLLETSRRNNEAAGVTGMLLYDAGTFLQVLEGKEAEVATIYSRIKCDMRHTDVIVLSRANIPERNFGDWTMGFYNAAANPLTNLPGFVDFFGRDFKLPELSGDPRKARRVLEGFRDGRWRRNVDAANQPVARNFRSLAGR